MEAEFSELVKKWHPVHISDVSKIDRKNILPGHGLVKNKSKEDGLEILKGRFVAGGHRQDVSDYDIFREVSTPTASLSSLFSVAAHAATKRLAIGSFDINKAYTKAPIPKNGRRIFILLTKTYVDLIKNISADLKLQYETFQRRIDQLL